MSKKLHYAKSASLKEKARYSKYLAEDEELILVTGYGTMHIREIFIIALAMPGFIFMALGFGLGYLIKHDSVAGAYGLLLGLMVAGVIGYFKAMVPALSIKYLLTTRRLIIKKGFFIVNLTSALYDKITHIDIHQGFVDRFFMYHGTVIINTAGMNKGEITLEYVDHPVQFKNLLERLINKEREHYGHQTGPIETVEGELVEEG